MTTDRNSEGAVATVIRKGAGLGGLAWTQAGRVADLPDAAPLYTTPPASIPAAEVQALVERLRVPIAYAREQNTMTFSNDWVDCRNHTRREIADELAKLIPRNPE